MKNSPSEKTSASNPLDHFDHVANLMLENRSFDNLFIGRRTIAALDQQEY